MSRRRVGGPAGNTGIITRGTAALLGASLAVGCSVTSSIHRVGAPALDAEIVDADAENLYVTDQGGQRYRVSRKSVRDVDHPGNVALTVGLGLLAMGAFIYFGNDEEGGTTEEVNHAMGLVYGIPGAISAGWGGYTWWTSREAAGRLGPVRPSRFPGIAPADVTLPATAPPLPLPAAPGSPTNFAPARPSAEPARGSRE